MAFDYRSELKRPVSLALAGAAVLGWLLALGSGFSSSNELQEAPGHRQHHRGLRKNPAVHLAPCERATSITLVTFPRRRASIGDAPPRTGSGVISHSRRIHGERIDIALLHQDRLQRAHAQLDLGEMTVVIVMVRHTGILS
jgi:hypothetical protein